MEPSTSDPRPSAAESLGATSPMGRPVTAGGAAARSLGYLGYAAHHTLTGTVLPALHATLHVQATVGAAVARALATDGHPLGAFVEASRRTRAGLRYHELVTTAGRALFGSARFAGEIVLAEDDILRLSYLPPTAPDAGVALFHAGGGLPYSDRIFRMLPEANFFDRFLERGLGVYAMELKGDRAAADPAGLTFDRLLDTIRGFSDAASAHAGGRPLILEGYCGHGMQALAYAAAFPADAARKFHALATFVAPIDGARCGALAELVHQQPDSLVAAELAACRATGGCVPGEGLGLSLDLALGTVFPKTPLGHFCAGFAEPAWADVGDVATLSPAQRRELAGAYWITHANSGRFPLPVDLVEFATRLFATGIGPDGAIPFRAFGRPLSLGAIARETSLPLAGFYGGRDAMVPGGTAACLAGLFGPRYTHVVHEHAGHISYVLSPKSWDPAQPKAFTPNPIDVLLGLVGNPAARPGGRRRRR